jgi:hypothetical protein
LYAEYHQAGADVGVDAQLVAAALVTIITLGTANAFVAATSRLGYAPARDRSLPASLSYLSSGGTPTRSIGVVAGIAIFEAWTQPGLLRQWVDAATSDPREGGRHRLEARSTPARRMATSRNAGGMRRQARWMS